MHKRLLTFLISMLTLFNGKAEEKDVIIYPVKEQYNNEGNRPARNPIYVPNVTIDGTTLHFEHSCIGCSIHLLQDDVIVYSDVVDENGEVQLPSNLSGVYQLQLQFGSITFVGEIEL